MVLLKAKHTSSVGREQAKKRRKRSMGESCSFAQPCFTHLVKAIHHAHGLMCDSNLSAPVIYISAEPFQGSSGFLFGSRGKALNGPILRHATGPPLSSEGLEAIGFMQLTPDASGKPLTETYVDYGESLSLGRQDAG